MGRGRWGRADGSRGRRSSLDTSWPRRSHAGHTGAMSAQHTTTIPASSGDTGPGHRTPEELEAFLPTVLATPKDVGTARARRAPAGQGRREVLDEGELDATVGLVGDSWSERGSSRTPDGRPHPDMQLNVMSASLVAFLAGDPDRRALAGDQLLPRPRPLARQPAGRHPPGHRRPRGAAARSSRSPRPPHTGCAKFVERFGAEAMRFVNGRDRPAAAAARPQRPRRRPRPGAPGRPRSPSTAPEPRSCESARAGPRSGLTRRRAAPAYGAAPTRRRAVAAVQQRKVCTAVGAATDATATGCRGRSRSWWARCSSASRHWPTTGWRPAAAAATCSTRRRRPSTPTVTVDLRNTTPDRGGFFYYYDAFSVPVPAGAEKRAGPQRGRAAAGVAQGHRGPVDQARPDLVPQPALRPLAHHRADLRGARREAARPTDSTRVGPGYATLRRLRRRRLRAQHRRGRRAVVDDVRRDAATTSPRPRRARARRTPRMTCHRRRRVLGRGVAARPRAHRRAHGRRRPASRCCSTASRTTRSGAASSPARSPRASRPWRSWSARSGPAGSSASGRTPRRRCAGTTAGSTPTDDEIVIGEQLDADLIFHELSHAWVSDERFDERWVSEGLAQVLAERAVKATGGKPSATTRRCPVASIDAVALNELGRLGEQPLRGRRRLRLPRGLRGDQRPDPPTSTTSALAAVLGAGIRGERAYDPVGTKDADGGRTDLAAVARPARDPGRRRRRRRRSSSAGRSPASSAPQLGPRADGARGLRRRSTRPTGRGCRPRGCATR